MDTVCASTLGEKIRPQMGTVFVDGYYQMGLSFLSKDKAKLARAYGHMFKLDMYYLGLDGDGNVMGMAACTDGNTPSVKVDAAELRRHLGRIRGTIAYPLSKAIFEHINTPFSFTPGMANVEFVATSAEHRGEGVATAVIRDMLAATPYSEYVLDVSDNNAPAVKVYERLGFKEFLRVEQNAIFRRMGLSALVYMKYIKDDFGHLDSE